MDHSLDQSFDQQGFEKPKQVSSSPNPKVIYKILKRLTGMVVLTEAEREEAGVYIGEHQDRKT